MEKMESRLMLSTTDAEINPPSLEIIENQLVANYIFANTGYKVTFENLDGTNYYWVAHSGDGGFADLYYSRQLQLDVIPVGTKVEVGPPTSDGLSLGNYWSHPITLDSTRPFGESLTAFRSGNWLLANSGNVVSVDFTVSGQDASSFSIFEADDLRPANFSITTSSDMSPKVVELATPMIASSSGEADQGGMIPIEKILSRNGTIGDTGGQATAPLASTQTGSLERTPAVRLATGTAPLPEISGEWARAAVVETAGGEPAFVVPTATNGGQRAGSGDAPSGTPTGRRVSVVPVPTATQYARVVAADDAAVVSSAETASAGRAAPVRLVSFVSEIEAGQWVRYGNRGPFRSNFLDSRRTAAGDWATSDQGTEGLPGEEPAVAQAFEQLGKGMTAVLHSSKDEHSWDGVRIATPLLMILALERVAATKARRAKNATEATKRPQRFGGPTKLPERE
jgi:hypothetical protein